MDTSAPSKESLERADRFLEARLGERTEMHRWIRALALEFDHIKAEACAGMREACAEHYCEVLHHANGYRLTCSCSWKGPNHNNFDWRNGEKNDIELYTLLQGDFAMHIRSLPDLAASRPKRGWAKEKP